MDKTKPIHNLIEDYPAKITTISEQKVDVAKSYNNQEIDINTAIKKIVALNKKEQRLLAESDATYYLLHQVNNLNLK